MSVYLISEGALNRTPDGRMSHFLLISPLFSALDRGQSTKRLALSLMKIFNNNALARSAGVHYVLRESDVTGLRDNQSEGAVVSAHVSLSMRLPINLGQFIIPSDAHQIYGRSTFDGKTAANE